MSSRDDDPHILCTSICILLCLPSTFKSMRVPTRLTSKDKGEKEEGGGVCMLLSGLLPHEALNRGIADLCAKRRKTLLRRRRFEHLRGGQLTATVPARSCSLIFSWASVMGAYSTISCLAGRSASTSSLILRSRNGRRMECSLDTTWLRCS